jgi:hypothetical protein
LIGQQIVSDETGYPLDNQGNRLAESTYQPPDDILRLFAKVQKDYQVAYNLQHRAFDEFDGYSLLQRANLDQQTFGVFVGADYIPGNRAWRFRGRKNTARNKIIGILAHMIAGMLYPYVYAKNDQNEEDKMTAKVMGILVEDHLRKADYEVKFLFMVLSALINPAVICEVEYVQALQTIKQKMADGTIKIVEAVDDLLSGLHLNILPIDQILLADFYTNDIQRQPYLIRVRRISWDEARKIYEDRFFDKDGTDLFGYVQAGKTRVVLTGNENQTLFDIEWTEADKDYVQEITAYYRNEDLQVTFVGGIFMGNQEDVYNSNPFQHRRMTLIKDQWMSIPVYPFAKSYFEPADPTGRFAYGKSAAAKEYWDDQALNLMHRLVLDGTYLDVVKPIFMSGVAKIDSVVMQPGATIGMPQGAQVTPYQLGPNLKAAYDAIKQQTSDMSESTQDKLQNGIADPNVTATAAIQAERNARVFLGVFGIMIAHLITQIGELTVDCVIQYATIPEVDNNVPGVLGAKYKTFLSKGKEKGADVTHRVVFTDKYMGRNITPAQQEKIEWKLYDQAGGYGSDQRIYEVNPYQFARYTYSLYVDPDKITLKSMGADRQEKMLAFNIMTDPRVAPYTDQKAVVRDFAVEEYGGPDADKYMKKDQSNPNEMMRSIMGGQDGQQQPQEGNLPDLSSLMGLSSQPAPQPAQQ